MGNCDHRNYMPELVELVQTGAVSPEQMLTQTGPLSSAYRELDRREAGWVKVELQPGR